MFKLKRLKKVDAWQFNGTLGSIIEAVERAEMNFVSGTWCGKQMLGLSRGISFDPQYRLEVGDWVILNPDGSIRIMPDWLFKTYISAK